MYVMKYVVLICAVLVFSIPASGKEAALSGASFSLEMGIANTDDLESEESQ